MKEASIDLLQYRWFKVSDRKVSESIWHLRAAGNFFFVRANAKSLSGSGRLPNLMGLKATIKLIGGRNNYSISAVDTYAEVTECMEPIFSRKQYWL